jgi:hypothetical protein
MDATMKRILIAGFLALWGTASYAAGQATPVKAGVYTPVGTGQFGTTVASATNLTVPAGATIAEICVETNAVRYRDDGTAPTSTIGIPVASGTCFQYAGNLLAIQFIAQTGSPTIDAEYYK